MARALRIDTAHVALDRRAGYLADLRERRARFESAGCRFWVFEDLEEAGRFTEFTEARDAATLAAAIEAAGDAAGVARLLTEVELT